MSITLVDRRSRAPSPHGDAAALRPLRRLSALALLAFWPALLAMAPPAAHAAAPTAGADPLAAARRAMVDKMVRKRGVTSAPVLRAMEEVPRHLFLPEPQREQAYDGSQITFAPGKALSHAYLSARMIELLELDGGGTVLEVGTGSGYDAALLSRLAGHVYTIEIDPQVAGSAAKTLRALGYSNVTVRSGDGYRGWPEKAPFDAILLTTAPATIPEPLFEQLKVGGKMVVAVGHFVQDLQVITKTADGRETRKVIAVRLGEMTGEAQDNP